MPAIEPLSKTFKTKRKAARLGASLKSLFWPEYSTVEVMRSLSVGSLRLSCPDNRRIPSWSAPLQKNSAIQVEV